MTKPEFMREFTTLKLDTQSESPALLLSARLFDDAQSSKALRGCTKFDPIFVVGPGSEKLHDAIDDALIEAGAMDTVTTWHSDEEDRKDIIAMIKTFLVQKQSPRLIVALSSESTDLLLKDLIEVEFR